MINKLIDSQVLKRIDEVAKRYDISSFKYIFNSKKTDYKNLVHLDKYRNKKGIYIFEVDKEVVYIGCAHSVNKVRQGLRDRLKQYYSNRSATFIKKHKLFASISEALVYVLVTDNIEKKQIMFDESFFIGALEPKYNY